MFIYKITCLKNSKCYIGLTNETIEKRFARHISDARLNKPTILHQAMRKYGVESFIVEQIDTADSYERLKELEKHYIQVFNSYVRSRAGYNCTLGGEGSDSPKINSRYGKGKKRPGSGVKISASLIGKPGVGRNTKNGVNHHFAKPICAQKVGTDEVLEFASAKIAASVLGIKTYGHINSVCKGRRAQTSGYLFWYADC